MAHAIPSGKRLGRVLLADDEEMVRMTLQLILTGAGFQVVEAVDGEDAVQKYLQAPNDFDVLLLDLDMPGLAGDEAIEKIKSQYHHAKAIVVSGGVNAPALPAGVRYLQKPFENKELIGMVRELL